MAERSWTLAPPVTHSFTKLASLIVPSRAATVRRLRPFTNRMRPLISTNSGADKLDDISFFSFGGRRFLRRIGSPSLSVPFSFLQLALFNKGFPCLINTPPHCLVETLSPEVPGSDSFLDSGFFFPLRAPNSPLLCSRVSFRPRAHKRLRNLFFLFPPDRTPPVGFPFAGTFPPEVRFHSKACGYRDRCQVPLFFLA